MRAPWFTDVRKQARVLNRIADKLIGKPDFFSNLRAVQIKMWDKFDNYQAAISIR